MCRDARLIAGNAEINGSDFFTGPVDSLHCSDEEERISDPKKVATYATVEKTQRYICRCRCVAKVRELWNGCFTYLCNWWEG